VARDPSGTAQGQRGLLYCTNGAPAGLIGYIHGGAFTVGSIGIMDNLAGELSKI
jgi:acetyl esterase/lipase